jgi:hypothetical protein
MTQLIRNNNILSKYIPEKSVPLISEWIIKFDFKLKIKKSRSTRLGDYLQPINGNNHQISINNDLNKYSFLITLIHEVAHLLTFNKFKNKVKPHGAEWKEQYKVLMQPFITTSIFPTDINEALINYMKNPAASSCSDLNLLRALKKHDINNNALLLENLTEGKIFTFNKKSYIMGTKVRTRYKCIEEKSKKTYLFNPLTEVLAE